MGQTSIEWTSTPLLDGTMAPGFTFNPWWGCQRVSPGCEHCYAETFAKRVGHGKRLPLIWGPSSERKFFGEEHWAQPLRWNAKAASERRRARVFCASMADVFEDRPNPRPGYHYEDRLRKERARLWRLIHDTPSLDWLLLTKRPENAERLAFQAFDDAFALATHDDVPATHWMTNIWLGTTVEDQKRADERIPELLKVPARVRFLSCEPLLELVHLKLSDWGSCFHEGYEGRDDEADHRECASHLDWVIVGGESGPRARPFDLAWARSIRSQCEQAHVPCFVKQLGSAPHGEWGDTNPPTALVEDMSGEQWTELSRFKNGRWRLRDSKGGSASEWPADLRIRQFPEVA